MRRMLLLFCLIAIIVIAGCATGQKNTSGHEGSSAQRGCH